MHEVVRICNYFGHPHNAVRLQEKSSATTTTSAAATGSHSFHIGRSDQHSARAVGDSDVADRECHRRFHRGSWRGSAQRFPSSISVGFHQLQPGREGSRRNTECHCSTDSNSASTTTSSSTTSRTYR